MRLRIRTLKPEMWQDEKIGVLSHGARLLFVGLVTMADDDGRLRALPALISGHVFPYDDVSGPDLDRWIGEVVAAGSVIAYEADGCRFLAFRNWSLHQRVNRPTPSVLPAPPMTARTAHEDFSERSVNSQCSLTEDSLPHAQARVPLSDPILIRSDSDLSAVVVGVSDSENAPTREHAPASAPAPAHTRGGDKKSSPPRSRRKVDQTTSPASFPVSLEPTLALAMPIVEAIQSERGGTVPSVRGVALAIEAYPDRDHMAVVRELQHWALIGGGRDRLVKDWSRTFATFLERTPAGSSPRVGGRARPESASDLLRALGGQGPGRQESASELLRAVNDPESDFHRALNSLETSP